MGLDTYLIRIPTRTPLSRYPPYDYSKVSEGFLRSCLGTSQKLPSCRNLQLEGAFWASIILGGDLLRSLLQNPWNFSELAPEA